MTRVRTQSLTWIVVDASQFNNIGGDGFQDDTENVENANRKSAISATAMTKFIFMTMKKQKMVFFSRRGSGVP